MTASSSPTLANPNPTTASDPVDIPVKGNVEAVLPTWGLLGLVTTIPLTTTSGSVVVDSAVVPETSAVRGRSFGRGRLLTSGWHRVPVLAG
jgi:hypothetical protein